MSQNKTIWTVQAPRVMDKAVKATVDNGLYKTKAELIREAVREKLEKLGFSFKLQTSVSCAPDEEKIEKGNGNSDDKRQIRTKN